MHGLEGFDLEEDRAGRLRVAWCCACGKRGSGATQKAAIAGFNRHARTALRREYWNA